MTKIKEVKLATDEVASLLTLIEPAADFISTLSLNDGDAAILKGFGRANAICTAAHMACERLEVIQEWLCMSGVVERAEAEEKAA